MSGWVALLSFERPQAGAPRLVASVDLENCTRPRVRKRVPRALALMTSRGGGQTHRQDSKSTRWMPWHQESKKDVDGCDKPR